MLRRATPPATDKPIIVPFPTGVEVGVGVAVDEEVVLEAEFVEVEVTMTSTVDPCCGGDDDEVVSSTDDGGDLGVDTGAADVDDGGWDVLLGGWVELGGAGVDDAGAGVLEVGGAAGELATSFELSAGGPIMGELMPPCRGTTLRTVPGLANCAREPSVAKSVTPDTTNSARSQRVDLCILSENSTGCVSRGERLEGFGRQEGCEGVECVHSMNDLTV